MKISSNKIWWLWYRQNIKTFIYLRTESLLNEILIMYIPRRIKLIIIEDDFFTIFVDSMLLNRVCFAICIVAKRPIDCIFVYIELFSLRFEQVGSEHCYSEVFIRSITSVKYSLQCLHRIQAGWFWYKIVCDLFITV